MTLSTAEIQAVVRDLKEKLEGGRIERIDQPDEHRLILRLRRGGCRYWLLLCAHPRFSRIHLLTHRPRGRTPPGGFCAVVRRHLTGCPIYSIEQVQNDRVVIIESTERDELLRPHRVRLIAELVGVGSNLILVDEGGRALGCLSTERSGRRRLVPGAEYQPLEPPPMGDVYLADAKKRIGGTVTLVGNIQTHDLMTAPTEHVKEIVKKCIETGKPQGRFALSPSAEPIVTPEITDLHRDNLLAYLQLGYDKGEY